MKVLFKSVYSGEPNPEKIDSHYQNKSCMYEEVTYLIQAVSDEDASKQALIIAREAETEYFNRYDEKVRVVDQVDYCFQLLDDQIGHGTEVFTRFLEFPKDVSDQEVIERLYPEIPDDAVELDG
ncbi:DUF4288 domain-containing protein [Risungbinella massiliensis]|uniref:DUF4288 domain-containing protein n=1 Tax=Risungbinella massiliensis TaxID=1329796 RepID=UPI00069A45D2|nr:DUF4288 domain-containing protein [Risungbinella massiliensis]